MRYPVPLPVRIWVQIPFLFFDFLFDRGFISFGDGRLLISDVADEKTLVKIGIDPQKKIEVGGFTEKQERFLDFHRREIFRTAKAA